MVLKVDSDAEHPPAAEGVDFVDDIVPETFLQDLQSRSRNSAIICATLASVLFLRAGIWDLLTFHVAE